MGSSFTKFLAQTVECDYRNTYCPKCETTCDQCGKPVTPCYNTPIGNIEYNNGFIMFADCYKVGFCEVQSCYLPTEHFGKYLISIRCLECDQRTKWSGGGKSYYNFIERSELNQYFDFTEQEHRVKKLPPLIKSNIIKKCCKNCIDSDQDMCEKLIDNYRFITTCHNMTYNYSDNCNDNYSDSCNDTN